MLDVKISGFYDEYSRNLDEQIARIKSYGESYLCPRHLDGKRITQYSYEEFMSQVKPRLDKEGIKFSSIGSPIGKVGINDDVAFNNQLKQLANLVKICEAMECKYIRMFSFNFHSNEKFEDYREKVMDRLKKYLEVVEGSNVILLHENEKGIYGSTADNCLDIAQTINHPQLQFIHDASNFIQVGEDPMRAYHMLKDYVVYYHIKDCDKLSRTETPVGLGDGMFAEMFADLSARNFSGFFTMEPHTFKYFYFRTPVYFVPFARCFMKEIYKAYRRVDKKLGKSMFKLISRKEIFDIQYSNLVKLIKETK